MIYKADGLLPCPFCGSIADMNYSNFIYCTNTLDCGAQMESGDSDIRTEKDRIIAAWNRRSGGGGCTGVGTSGAGGGGKIIPNEGAAGFQYQWRVKSEPEPDTGEI